ncbi:MAG: hypothetical protein RQ982_03340 [Gammaproteobacteria bacterium]|nr:hypothetical protein [Gammaproteobacteria bacterium]
MSRCRVAVLGKDYGHYLRTAPCRETPQERWTRNYHLERVLGYSGCVSDFIIRQSPDATVDTEIFIALGNASKVNNNACHDWLFRLRSSLKV